MHRKIAALAAAGALAVPAAAQAHVTVQPKAAPAGAFTVLDVRVPNERDTGNTTQVDVKFPAGFAEVSYQSTPGWNVKVVKSKLDKPVQTDDGPVTEGVTEMIWTATSPKAAIAPGQFRDFPISVQVPGKAGDTLTFKALQTYSNGEVVRWIGSPDAELPAPQVQVTAAADSAAATAAKPAAAAPAPAAKSTSDGNGLSIVALIVGALGLIAGLGSFVLARRTAARAEREQEREGALV
jgi:uncharacterized protein YcnI